MKTVTHAFLLISQDDESECEIVEIDLSATRHLEKIIVDGNDLTHASAQDLMKALVTRKRLKQLAEKDFPEELESYDHMIHRKFRAL